ncbi:MAG: hypothetical protein LBC76_07510 [Treponema sp.]|jgi:hypothetical protein|nr:hypothetical protein [Treponema sp.]
MNAKQTKAAARKQADSIEPKRPVANPSLPEQMIEDINNDFNNIKRKLENYAAHLRATNRQRLNGIGIKTQSFVERAYRHATESPEFLPPYLSLEKFREDFVYYTGIRSLMDVDDQLREILWNITLRSADTVYTDSLEYYAMVHEAARRRIDPAETIYKDLAPFFKKWKKHTDKLTAKEAVRDANALLDGRKDGKIIIENVKPKLTGGVHKVVEEKLSDNAMESL